MKKIISILTIGMVAATHAAIVTYDFDAGLGDSTSGADLTAGTIAYAIGTNSDGSPNSSERAWNPATTSGDYELNIGQRGVGNSGTADEDLAPGVASQLTFTLTPNAGEALSFATSSLDFTSLIYNDGSNQTMSIAYKIWADTGTGLEAIAPRQTHNVTSVKDTLSILTKTDEGTPLPGFGLVNGQMNMQSSALSFDLSTIGLLEADQAITLAITISGNRNNQFTWGNSVDDIVVDNIVVPEPVTLSLIASAGAGLLFIRRKFMP